MHGSLHSPDAFNFYKSLGAGERVLSIIKNGLKLPWDSPLPKFWYKNNSTANHDIVFLRAKVKDWLDGGYIVKVDSRPDHISPFTVDTGTFHDGTIKKRLCFDATFVNAKLVKESTKLPTMSDYGKVAFAVPKEGLDTEYDFYVILVIVLWP